MARPIILSDTCKGCGLCVTACPKKILVLSKEHINQKGYFPVTCTDESACIGCAMCAIICPDCVFTIEK